MSALVDRAIIGLAALGESAAFLEILRRSLQRRQEKHREQLQLDVRFLEEGRPSARARGPAGPVEERERRHKAELAALAPSCKGSWKRWPRVNEGLIKRLEGAELRGRGASPALQRRLLSVPLTRNQMLGSSLAR